MEIDKPQNSLIKHHKVHSLILGNLLILMLNIFSTGNAYEKIGIFEGLPFLNNQAILAK